ncbi:MAG: rsmE [Verrucomicrobia bacterium]|nr:rsmE [Verrucomicrobiota bacterium]
MHRFFVPSAELRQVRFQLPEAEARHAAQVLRVRAGDKVQALDGAGRTYDCTVDAVERRQVWLKVAHENLVPAPKVAVEVYPAVAKGKAMEIIIQKLKQCGREWLPEVTSPRPFKQCLPSAGEASCLNLVAALRPGAVLTGERISAYFNTHGALPRTIRLWVGPEGDFSSGEYQDLAAHDVLPITLGTHVLRCETALLALLAVCQHEIAVRS